LGWALEDRHTHIRTLRVEHQDLAVSVKATCTQMIRSERQNNAFHHFDTWHSNHDVGYNQASARGSKTHTQQQQQGAVLFVRSVERTENHSQESSQ